jgi:hypothetical protein
VGNSAQVPTLPEWGLILLGMLLAFIYWCQAVRQVRRRAQ